MVGGRERWLEEGKYRQGGGGDGERAACAVFSGQCARVSVPW